MRHLIYALLVWLGLILIAGIIGGFLSLWTGRGQDLPKWNGWPYLAFSIGEGIKFGALLASPIALFVLAILWFTTKKT